MHAQTESHCERRAATASILSTATGLGLYFLTLAGEATLGAGVRWLLIYLGAAIVGAFVPLGLSAEVFAWIAALVPLAWSLFGLARPGRGWIWRRRLGARRPSAEETMVVGEALELLRSADPSFPQRIDYYVLDDPLPAAAVRGRALTLSRGLIESDSLAPVLAHELGHAESLDGRLTEALNRLAIWDDPLGPQRAEGGGEARVEFEEPGGGLLWGCARWALRLSGGGFTQHLLSPLWAAHWRAREYAADAHAAALGQAEDLAQHLSDYELPFDAPQRRLFFNASQHPPVALRVERLRGGFAAEGSE